MSAGAAALRTDFRLSATRSTRDLIAFGVIAAGVLIWSYVTDESVDVREWMFVAGAALIVLGVWNWRAARLRALAAAGGEPGLSIGDDGVAMPELFAERVPWEAIRKIDLASTRAGNYAVFQIDDVSRYGFRANALVRLERLVGLGVRFNLRRLEAEVDHVAAALRRHAPARIAGRL